MSVNIFPNNIYWKVMFCMVDFPQKKVLFKNILTVLMWAIPFRVPGRLEMVVAKQPGQSLRKPPKWRTPWTGKPSKGWEINPLGLSKLYSLSWGFVFKISIFVCNYHKFMRNYLAIKVTRASSLSDSKIWEQIPGPEEVEKGSKPSVYLNALVQNSLHSLWKLGHVYLFSRKPGD